ncbi:MAG: EipB family protein [Aestuariivirga sp.]
MGFPAEAATIAAHRAIYDLKLVRSNEGSSLASVNGRLAFEIQGSVCEGWTVSFRMVNQFSPAEGAQRIVDTQSTSFESGDGLDMQYSQKEFVDRKLRVETRIKVSRPTAQAEAAGEMAEDKAKPFTVPGGAFFPMQHQLNLMDKAERSETRDTSLIFDGSDGATTYRAISFIGRRKNAGGNARDNANSVAKPLAALASWPVSISYYKTDTADQETPSYQVGFDLYANGVATGLVLDYGEFVLGGELAQMELLKSDPCP